MFKFRLISFPLLLALLAAMFFWRGVGEMLFMIVAPLAMAAAVYEVALLVQKMQIRTAPRTAALFALLLACGLLATVLNRRPGAASLLVLLVLAAAILLPWLVILCRRDGGFAALLGSLGVGVCVFGALSPLFFLYRINFSGGVPALLYLLLVSKSMDTGGYVAGMLSHRWLPGGNHKIAPVLSPNKSWEGFFGGLLLAVGTALIFRNFSPALTWGFTFTAAVVLALGSFFGDLTESALKRACGVKDAGNWIPGMGGVCDVLDSLIYNGIMFGLLLAVFRAV